MYEPEFLPVVNKALKAKDDIKKAEEDERRRAAEQDDDSSLMVELLEEKEETLKKVAPGSLPIVPPKVLKTEQAAEEEEEAWFFVQSPRELHGAVGPFALDELRSYRRMGKLHDTTLMWTAEFTNWKPLGNITNLKNRLLALPPIPQRPSADKRIDDPVIDIPAILSSDECEPLSKVGLDKFSSSLSCCRCGAPAVTHLPETGEQRPDFKVLRQGVGNFQDASEVIPGLLWIGNASTGRSKFFVKYGMDLTINCSDTLKTPPSKPPHYRCKQIPFKEVRTADRDLDGGTHKSSRSLVSSLSTASLTPPTLDESLQLFDMFYDMVEIARVSPERLQEEDLRPPDYRGALDRYGRPLRTKEEAALWKATNKNKQFDRQNLNILAWSRLGFDRPCAATAAYLVRKWGLTLEHALDVVSVARIGTNLSAHYLQALEVYSVRHSLGDMLCEDCAASGLTKTERAKDQNMKIAGLEHLLPEADKDMYNCLLSAGQSSSSFSVVMGKLGELKSVFSLHRAYVGHPRLMELRLAGRRLDDQDVERLSSLLALAGVLPQLCLLDLSTNCIGCAGVAALCSALCAACPASDCELTSLWLQHNQIGPAGGEALTSLLRPGYMLHTLDVEDNQLGDEGVGAIALSLIVPEKDLFEDEGGAEQEELDVSMMPQNVQDNIRRQQEKQAAEDAKYLGNQTVTSLNISNNNFARETMDNISQILKTNKALKKLNMDCILTVKPNDIANLINCCKIYNKTLTAISMTDTLLPASVVGMLFKLLASSSPLARLDLSRCGLTDLHVMRNVKLLGSAKHVTHLSLSGNPLSDGVVPALCMGIEGKIDQESGRHIPPLQELDLSNCGLTMRGGLQVARAVGGRGCVRRLLLAGNELKGDGVDVAAFAEALQMSSLHTIDLSYCCLGTKLTERILLALKSTNDQLCGHTLRRLLLSGNDIHDSIDSSLSQFLAENSLVQHLDLGFNCLTSAGLQQSRRAVEVSSSSRPLRKLNDLHITLLGNPCEHDHPLDFPGMSRSKVTLRLGHERSHDPMEHVQAGLRVHYMSRIKTNGDLVTDLPTSSLVRFNSCT